SHSPIQLVSSIPQFIRRIDRSSVSCRRGRRHSLSSSQQNSTTNNQLLKSNFYIPETALIKEVIQSFWQIEGFTSHRNEHILPKGMVEIIFNFSEGSPTVAQVGKKQYQLPQSF